MAIALQSIRKECNISIRVVLPVITNLSLILVGSLVFVYGMNAIMIPAGLFSGGLTGLVILIKLVFPKINLGLVYILLNIPLLLLAWFTISKRFLAYSIFGILCFSLIADMFHPKVILLSDPFLATLLGGVICGVGSGLILRSLGSAGGMDILAIFMNKYFGVRIGTIYFASNALIIIVGGYVSDLNSALYSTLLLFVSGRVINSVASGFSARMAVMVVSDHSEEIAKQIIERLNGGVTFLEGQGAYSRQNKRVILTVTTLTELPKLKELIIQKDANAFVVINNTMEVLGQRHGALRVY
ncbi:MAG: YitT family protein [Desulfobacteraceae bacterium]|jgi:uncharacterized membrane-anchored protein YitT (DUF2179 family)